MSSHRSVVHVLACLCAISLIGCVPPPSPADPPTAPAVPVCHVVYDAGSSGTRLYLYEAQADGSWRGVEGPKAGALADPVREGGKILDDADADADAVAAEIAGLLPQLRREYDWTRACKLGSVALLATAGMRLAEQAQPDRAAQIYAKVEAALADVLADAGVSAPIEVRTLTGFEEGLYAWLTLPGGPSPAIGVAEMGGASTQVAFVCPGCEGAVPVRVGDQILEVFSYSFLGLGVNEAPTTIGEGIDPDCSYGVGLDHPDWTPATCTATMNFGPGPGIVDPYNYGPEGQGSRVQLPIDRFSGTWRLSGGFSYWKPEDVEACCLAKACDGFAPEGSCFRALYMPTYLNALGILNVDALNMDASTVDALKVDSSWTLGAVICKAQDCLAELPAPPPCRWRRDGCGR